MNWGADALANFREKLHLLAIAASERIGNAEREFCEEALRGFQRAAGCDARQVKIWRNTADMMESWTWCRIAA
jgi:hypothetical protein